MRESGVEKEEDATKGEKGKKRKPGFVGIARTKGKKRKGRNTVEKGVTGEGSVDKNKTGGTTVPPRQRPIHQILSPNNKGKPDRFPNSHLRFRGRGEREGGTKSGHTQKKKRRENHDFLFPG